MFETNIIPIIFYLVIGIGFENEIENEIFLLIELERAITLNFIHPQTESGKLKLCTVGVSSTPTIHIYTPFIYD